MSFERSYFIESHERIKRILIFAEKSLLGGSHIASLKLTMLSNCISARASKQNSLKSSLRLERWQG